MPRSSGSDVPETVYFPGTKAILLRVRLGAVTFVLLGLWVCWVLGLPPGGWLVCSSLIPLIALFEAFVRFQRAWRTRVFLDGLDWNAVVVEKITTPMGPCYLLGVEYRVEDTVLKTSSRVPLNVWLRYRVGDAVTIRLIPTKPQYWILAAREPEEVP